MIQKIMFLCGLKLNMFKTLKNLNNDIKVIGPFKDYKRYPFVIKREILKLSI